MPVNASGIYIPNKLKIENATATPSDVLKDKIFYNNDGRQIGNGFLLENVRELVVTKPDNATEETVSLDLWAKFAFDGSNLRFYDGLGGGNGFDYWGSVSLPADRIIGFIYNGIKYMFSFCCNTGSGVIFTIGEPSSWGQYVFLIAGNAVRFGKQWSGGSLTILY